jgi:hypothetical protein
VRASAPISADQTQTGREQEGQPDQEADAREAEDRHGVAGGNWSLDDLENWMAATSRTLLLVRPSS